MLIVLEVYGNRHFVISSAIRSPQIFCIQDRKHLAGVRTFHHGFVVG